MGIQEVARSIRVSSSKIEHFSIPRHRRIIETSAFCPLLPSSETIFARKVESARDSSRDGSGNRPPLDALGEQCVLPGGRSPPEAFSSISPQPLRRSKTFSEGNLSFYDGQFPDDG